MRIFYNTESEMARFAMESVSEAARIRGITLMVSTLSQAPAIPLKGDLVAQNRGDIELRGRERAIGGDAEHYTLERSSKGGFVLTANGEAGVMFALMDVADMLTSGGEEGMKERTFKPTLELRGVKFNLPFEPYETGDAFEKNIATCLNVDFWREYIDMLARNRYNMLSLWSEHPFHMMFRIARYPQTCPYSDEVLAQYQMLFHFIFRHAHMRGIKVFLITWNIRLPQAAVMGLGLPRELANPYPQPSDAVVLGSPPHRALMNGARQAQPVVKDYIKECIRTLLMTYPELDALGTNCAEEMVGTAQERQQWVEEAYIEGIRESGRTIPFIMRTNCGTCKLAEEFLEKCPARTNYVSWKYSYAHMYSSAAPAFEQLENVWENIKHKENLNVLFTVRNDDFHTLRWGDVDFIRAYLANMAEKPYCRGYYWGCDGYMYASDFSHDPHGHKTWKYDFEKHWQEFSLLGRIGYDSATPESYWQSQYGRLYGEYGPRLYDSLKLASGIIPLVNRLHWMDIDVRWHPESLLSIFGFKTVLDTYYNPAMPGTDTVSIRQYAAQEQQGNAVAGETPPKVIAELLRIADGLKAHLTILSEAGLIGEGECLLEDLHCWQALASFYAARFSAALALARLDVTKDEAYRQIAVDAALAERPAWEQLQAHWGSHYTGYLMARSKMRFGYGLYWKDVERDVELIHSFGKVKTEPRDYWVRHNIQKA